MKHKRSVLSIGLATIMLVSLCAVVSTTSVSAATSAATSSSATVQSGLIGAPAGIVGDPAVSSHGTGLLDLFVRGKDSTIWWRSWTLGVGWSTWTSLGGYVTSSPAATSPSAGKLYVAARGGDGALYDRYTTDGGLTWSTWSSYGGQILVGTGPTAYDWGDVRIGWFVTGTNHALYHMWDDASGRHSWNFLGGYLTSSPAAVAIPAQVVFARGNDGALWSRDTSDGGVSWNPWTSLGGQIATGTGPAACSLGGRVDVFVQGTSGALYHRWVKPYGTGLWSGWESLGGKLTSSPAADRFTEIDVFALGSDGAIWSIYTTNGGTSWNPWYKLPA